MQKNTKLRDQRAAILATDGFEQSELAVPLEKMREAGIQVDLVSPKDDQIRGWKDGDWGDRFPVDVRLADADPARYDALVLPGGVMNPDALRLDTGAIDFVRRFFREGKIVAAICHGPWLLIDAGVAQGRRMTSWPSIRADLQNAGAIWEDSEVAVDQGLVTSRSPADLPAFCDKLLEEVAEGRHELQKTSG